MLLDVLLGYGSPAEHQRPLEDSPLEVIDEHVAEEGGPGRERTQREQLQHGPSRERENLWAGSTSCPCR